MNGIEGLGSPALGDGDVDGLSKTSLEGMDLDKEIGSLVGLDPNSSTARTGNVEGNCCSFLG